MTSRHERREADRLDETIDALLRGEQPAPSTLELGHESALVGALVAAREDLESEVSPSRAFSSSLRVRLVAEAERMADAARTAPAASQAPAQLSLVRTGSRAGARRPRLLAGLMAGALMAGTGAAAAAASSSALPGEALYSVKRGIERLSLIGDEPAEAGRERLEQASTRLDEALALSERDRAGDDELAADAIAEFAARATEGGAALLAAEVDGQDGSADAVRAFTTESRSRIIALSSTADDDVFMALVTAANTVYALDSQVEAMCPTCSGTVAPLAPFARAAEEAGQVLRGLTGTDVTAEETAREAAERVARETPRKMRQVRETPTGQKGTSTREGREAPAAPEPATPQGTSPTPILPAVPELTEVPVVGTTLEDVQEVVEESVVRELQEQVGKVGKITEGVVGDTGLLP